MYLQQWIWGRWNQLHKYVWAENFVQFTYQTLYSCFQNLPSLTVRMSLSYTMGLYCCMSTLFHSDIDECELDSLNDCDENANCIDTIGSYNCSCSPGYEGDGFNCTGVLLFLNRLLLFCRVQLHADSILTDINECQLGTDLCMNAECNNTAGSYTCSPCFPGFIPGNLTSCSEFCLHVY